jgi:hypothetical protein
LEKKFLHNSNYHSARIQKRKGRGKNIEQCIFSPCFDF